MHLESLRAARSLLAGHTLLIVGGDERPETLHRLVDAFDLRGVDHRPTRKHDASARRFADAFAQPGLILGIGVLGLARTNHMRELHQRCRAIGLPWIDARRIPHPHLLASEIDRLRLADRLLGRRLALRGPVLPARRAGAA